MTTSNMPLFQPNSRILFQGDSITDGNRGRSADQNHILGHGYVFIIAAKYGALMPERNLTFINRGVSGDNAGHLRRRWQEDALDLNPDVLSILIGINDASNNVPVDEYEKDLDFILSASLAANPALRLILCEPFTVPRLTPRPDWDSWRANVQSRQDVVARAAAKYHAPLVRFQSAFDAVQDKAHAEYWLWDSVHPTYSGHQIMADEWIRTVS